MSTSITLLAALPLTQAILQKLRFGFTIPVGTILQFDDAADLDAVAEMLWGFGGTALVDNLAQVDRTITSSGLSGIADGHQVLVTHKAFGRRVYRDFNVSSSPSGSPSLSPSASVSLSPSLSASLSPSASISRSPSASPSRSPSAS